MTSATIHWAMPIFSNSGIPISYADRGEGAAIVLLHGFAANAQSNWGITLWLRYLETTYRVIAPDLRGHGASAKPHDPSFYRIELMARDVLALMNHLGLGRVLLMGYSMGALVALRLALDAQVRLRAAVLGGVGLGLFASNPVPAERIAQALLAADAASLRDPILILFRRFAEGNRNDLRALAACMRRPRPDLELSALRGMNLPTLFVTGSLDRIVGDAPGLAAMVPNSQFLELTGRDHLNAVGDRRFKEAVSKFLAAAPL